MFRDAISCSLELLGAEPLSEDKDDAGSPVWTFPPLDRRAATDPSWTATLDTLRIPRKTNEKLAEWRRDAPIRPVVFEASKTLTEDTVHLHLEQVPSKMRQSALRKAIRSRPPRPPMVRPPETPRQTRRTSPRIVNIRHNSDPATKPKTPPS